MAKVQGSETAIYRTTPPEPFRWLKEKGLIRGRVLDYGPGRGQWYGATRYDPEQYPHWPEGRYDTIVVNYVLNIVDEETQADVIRKVQGLLAPGGIAYFSVRRDLPKEGKAGRGTYQRYVVLPFNIVHETSARVIYSWQNVQLHSEPARYPMSKAFRLNLPRSRTGLGRIR